MKVAEFIKEHSCENCACGKNGCSMYKLMKEQDYYPYQYVCKEWLEYKEEYTLTFFEAMCKANENKNKNVTNKMFPNSEYGIKDGVLLDMLDKPPSEKEQLERWKVL